MDVSFQLYSSREVPSQVAFLRTLADLGYTQVEGYGGVYDDPTGFRDALDAVGLTMPSGHFALDALETEFDSCLQIARSLGMQRLYAPYLAASDRPTHSAGYAALARRLAAVGSWVQDEGLTFGWHNHDFELAPLTDGGIPLEILLTEAPAITWEGDLAWIIRSGADPVDWVTRHGARLSAVHVKDIATPGQNADEDGWADVGQGAVDWAYLTAQVRAAAPDALMIMEHDKPSDATRFARNSIQAFSKY